MIDLRQLPKEKFDEFVRSPDREAIKRVHYRDNFDDFCFSCLGFVGMIGIHFELCRFMSEVGKKFKLVLMPRYSFKSTICTVGYTLWRLTKDVNLRVLIYSDATQKAVGFLDSVKAHIEGKVAGSKFREDFGKWEGDIKSGSWNRDKMTVRVRETSYPEPSVDTGGEGTAKVGFHYDLIIFDDLVTDQNTTTKSQMDKMVECYRKALSLLRPGGEVIVVGTRWHFGDLYGRVIAENGKKESFGIFVKNAEYDEKWGAYPFSRIGLTQEFLARQKMEQGSSLYSCIYNNNPVSDETAVFKMDNFSFYGEVKPDDLYITCTVDPAGEGEDFTGITVVGTDSKMDMYVLEAIGEHLQPSEIVEKIIVLQYRYRFGILGVETNFFRGMLEVEIKRRRDEEHKANPEKFKLFGVHEFEASSKKGAGKHARIMSLQPFHERRSIKFPGDRFELLEKGFGELGWQMVQYTHDGAKSPNDDIIDSLAYHVPLIRQGGVVKKAGLPKGSPAWFEREQMEREIINNNRLPRRFRGRINTQLAFS